MTPLQKQYYKTYWWLAENHRWAVINCEVSPALVHPKKKRIVDNAKENTLLQYWVEAGQFDKRGGVWHDIRLDTGGSSYEEAFVKFGRLVKKYYGNKSKDTV